MCKGGPILHEFIYNNIQLEIVVSFKYLGINLYNNGCWLRTHKRTAHHSVYGNLGIYFPSKIVELIHIKFLRKILNVNKSTYLDGLYGKLGRYTMHIKRTILIMKYWIEILNQPDHSLMKQVYNMLQLDSDININYF